MNFSIKHILLLLTTGMLFGFTMKKEEKGSLTINFNHLFKGEEIDFSKEFTNSHGEKVKFSMLNYFISNIRLTRKDGSTYVVPQDSSYFLIKESEPETKKVILKNIPNGKYSAITLTVGVDSLRNTMDISKRTGALDVGGIATGMYWVWNSGYIFFKMEGTSPAAPDRQKNKFAYHVGGFGGFNTKTINSIRTKEFPLKELLVTKSKVPTINVDLDLAGLFDAQTPITIARNPSVMWGEISTSIADNYITCFKLGKVSYN
ncbi:MbnP family protein [Pedobacter sp. GR22-6]|uniref:MbnP family protein n=1 Tax=Pedobacter sp. GR22-6 TaxID=3127957 RepID=UPI00307E1E4D